MMVPPRFHNGDTPRHVTDDEYSTFLRRYARLAYVEELRRARRTLASAYPDLGVWLALPLDQRLTDQGRRGPYGGHVDKHAEWAYLIYLALHGRITLDWEFLIAAPRLHIARFLPHLAWDTGTEGLIAQMVDMGYARAGVLSIANYAVARLFVHLGHAHVDALRGEHIDAMIDAHRQFYARPDARQFVRSGHPMSQGPMEHVLPKQAQVLRRVLYERHQVALEPTIVRGPKATRPLPVRMEATLDRYMTLMRPQHRPGSTAKIAFSIRHFGLWVSDMHPDVDTFAQVTRLHIEGYAAALLALTSPKTGRPWGPAHRRGTLSNLNVFFRHTLEWGWDDVPGRPIMGARDLPRVPLRLPRNIRPDHVEVIMGGIRALDCPYQRAALLVARWGGARRDEIRRLARDCLSAYSDGMPKLLIPVGKTHRERQVPLLEEAAEAIKAVQSLSPPGRGLTDSHTGQVTCYLFIRRGGLLSKDYLLWQPLARICAANGLPAYTPHQLRHTYGTQLAEKKARLQTIMTLMGHASAAMSMSYIALSDETVKDEYEAALGRAGAAATVNVFLPETVPQDEVDWMKTNFFKSELELGHCLRLPEEGPCECDQYLFCASFLTSRDKAPRLRCRRRIEASLAEDAGERGWEAEMNRHLRLATRCEELLTRLGEPIDGPEADDC